MQHLQAGRGKRLVLRLQRPAFSAPRFGSILRLGRRPRAKRDGGCSAGTEQWRDNPDAPLGSQVFGVGVAADLRLFRRNRAKRRAPVSQRLGIQKGLWACGPTAQRARATKMLFSAPSLLSTMTTGPGRPLTPRPTAATLLLHQKGENQ